MPSYIPQAQFRKHGISKSCLSFMVVLSRAHDNGLLPNYWSSTALVASVRSCALVIRLAVMSGRHAAESACNIYK